MSASRAGRNPASEAEIHLLSFNFLSAVIAVRFSVTI